MHSTIRIFISSPGDVASERQIAGKVIEQIQGKYWSFVRIDDVFWEDRAVRATAHYQDELINPGDCEIVVGILFSRLGSPLPPKFQKLEGTTPTGTEWELEEAFAAYDASLEETGDPETAKPDILVYRRKEKVSGKNKEDSEDTEAKKQRAALEEYLTENYFNEDGTISRPLLGYESNDDFESKFRSHLEELVLRMIPGLKQGDEPPPISGCPFKGLSAFHFDDHDRYFGRNREIREVIDRLVDRKEKGPGFLLIYGASGYGKSSLMRAGVAPTVTRPGAIDSIEDSTWRTVLLEPNREQGPLSERLARVILKEPTKKETERQASDKSAPISGLPEVRKQAIPSPESPEAFWDVASLSRHFDHQEDYVFAVAAIQTALEGENARLLIQLDQLEEVFGKEIEDSERDSFFRALLALSHCSRVWILATMRSEFFPRIAESTYLKTLVGGDGGYILSPPGAQMLNEIVRFPALAARLQYGRTTQVRNIAGEPSTAEFLSDQIYNDALKNPDALPLLEFCLTQLYEDTLGEDGTPSSDTLSWDYYENMGGLYGSIVSAAERTYSELPSAIQNKSNFARLFSSLVHVEPSTDAESRRRADLKQLEAQAGLGPIVAAFRDAKLLVTDQETSVDDKGKSQTVVFLAHDCLLTHWEELATWIDKHRGDLRALQRLREQTELYEQNGKQKNDLLSAARLSEAKDVEESGLFHLEEGEREFLGRSQHEAARKLRRLKGAAALFAVLAVVAAFFGFVAKRESQESDRNAAEAKKNAKEAQRQTEEAVAASDTANQTIRESAIKAWGTATEAFDSELNHAKGFAYLAEAVRLNERLPENLVIDAIYLDSQLRTIGNPVVDGGFPTAVISNSTRLHDPIFSEDGRFLVAQTFMPSKIVVWDANKDYHEISNTLASGPYRYFRFLPGTSKFFGIPNERSTQLVIRKAGKGEIVTLSHDEKVYHAFVSSNLLCTSAPYASKLWDIKTLDEVDLNISFYFEIKSISQDGKKVIGVTRNESIELYDLVEQRAIIDSIDPTRTVHWADFTPSGDTFATAEYPRSNMQIFCIIKLWDVETNTQLGGEIEHRYRGGHPAFSSDGSMMATAASRGVEIHSTSTGELIRTLNPGRDIDVEVVRFTPNGLNIASSCSDGTIRFWNVFTGEPTYPPLKHPISPSTMAFKPNGTSIATTSLQGGLDEISQMQIWELYGKNIRKRCQIMRFHGGLRKIVKVAEGRGIIGINSKGNALLRQLDSEDHFPIEPIKDRIIDIFPSPIGDSIAVTEANGFVSLRGGENFQSVLEQFEFNGNMHSVQFSQDGNAILFLIEQVNVKGDRPVTARIFCFADGVWAERKSIYGVSLETILAPNGDHLVSATTSGLRVLKIGEATEVWRSSANFGVFPETATDVIISPDGQRVAAGFRNGGILMGDIRTAQFNYSCKLEPRHSRVKASPFENSDITSLDYSGNSDLLAVSSNNGDVTLFRTIGNNVNQVGRFSHQGPVKNVCFSNDNRLLLTVSSNTFDESKSGVFQARLWDVDTQSPVGFPIFLERDYAGCRFLEGGTQFFAGHRDGTVEIWKVPNRIGWDELSNLLHVIGGAIIGENGRLRTLTYEDRIKTRNLLLQNRESSEFDLLVRLILNDLKSGDGGQLADFAISNRIFSEIDWLSFKDGQSDRLELAFRASASDPSNPLPYFAIAHSLSDIHKANFYAHFGDSLLGSYEGNRSKMEGAVDRWKKKIEGKKKPQFPLKQ